MMDCIEFLLLLAAAVLMIVPAVRHPEWRGGLLTLGCIFLATAMNANDEYWTSLIPKEYLDEPELIPIILCIIGATISAFLNKRSTLAGFKAVWRNRRFPILVLGLLLVSVLSNIAKNRHVWELFVPVSDITHGVRELAQNSVRFLGSSVLLLWTILFLKDKRRVLRHRPSSHEYLMWCNPLVPVGQGTRRQTYRIGDTGFCVKFYRPVEDCAQDKMKRSIRREITWRRFSRIWNSSSQEVYVYEKFRHMMPPAVKEKMPAVCERVFHHKHGWGVLETYYTNPDGSPIIPYEFEIQRQSSANREIIYVQAKALLDILIHFAAPFYEPGNFHVLIHSDGTIDLKLIDFEPTSKNLIPVESFWPWFRRRKLSRKAERYLQHIRQTYGIKGELV